jgi:hypothetical protein
MRIRLLSFVAGVLLILPIAFVTEQELFVLRRSDVMNGLKPLVAIPLESVQNQASISREVVIPSEGWWKRMTSFYGEPRLLITVVNVPVGAAGHGRRTYTYEEVGIRIKVFRGTSEIPLEPTNDAPYAYSSEMSHSGWLFQAEPGETLTLVIGSSGFARLPGEIVVVPAWPRGEIPSALDGFAFVHGVRWILVTGAGVGIALIVFGLRRLRRKSP